MSPVIEHFTPFAMKTELVHNTRTQEVLTLRSLFSLQTADKREECYSCQNNILQHQLRTTVFFGHKNKHNIGMVSDSPTPYPFKSDISKKKLGPHIYKENQ